jgi:penicillin-binding protein 1A
MQSVMDHGTGFPARARGFTIPAAGKTGTMDNYMDAWFVGFVPSLVCGVWVGYDEKKPIGRGMTGAMAALPIWTDFMLGATRAKPVEDFPMPAGTLSRTSFNGLGISVNRRAIMACGVAAVNGVWPPSIS